MANAATPQDAITRSLNAEAAIRKLRVKTANALADAPASGGETFRPDTIIRVARVSFSSAGSDTIPFVASDIVYSVGTAFLLDDVSHTIGVNAPGFPAGTSALVFVTGLSLACTVSAANYPTGGFARLSVGGCSNDGNPDDTFVVFDVAGGSFTWRTHLDVTEASTPIGVTPTLTDALTGALIPFAVDATLSLTAWIVSP